jgi:hypothetical protein
VKAFVGPDLDRVSTSESFRSLPRPLLVILSGARFVVAAGLACAASALFYGATCLALYFVLLVLAGVTNTGVGSPLAGIIWPIVLFFVGLVMALIVYTPITFLTFALARGRMWVWLVAPVLVGVISFTISIVCAAGVESTKPLDFWTGRAGLALVLPYFFAGGYCIHWLVVFVPCQLGPWLLRKLDRG